MGFWHNVIDKHLENQLVENHCFPKELSIYIVPTKDPSPKCGELFTQFETKMGEINIYDVYRKCWHDDKLRFNGSLPGMTAQDYTPWLFPELNKKGLRLEQNGVPCVYAKGTTAFFNEDTVKRKLHANEDKVGTWELCTNGKKIKYTSGIGSIHLYQDLVDAGLRILHFTGNTDGAVPAIGTRTWVYNSGWPVTQEYQPYYVRNKQVGGYAEIRGKFTYATAQGVGHMVPQWKPEVGYHLFSKFLKDEPLVPPEEFHMSSE